MSRRPRKVMTGTCEACVWGRGKHAEGCTNKWVKILREVFSPNSGEPPSRSHPQLTQLRLEPRRIRLKPTIGRIVIYHHPGSADGKYPHADSPAIIQNVAPDGSCRLFVFGPKGQHQDGGLTEGTGPCQWSWPPRV